MMHPETTTAEPAKVPRAVNLSRELAELLAQVSMETGVPGVGIALSVRGDRSTAYRGYLASGAELPVSSLSRFQLGCITKVLTALVSAELVLAGKLEPESPIGRYLPELAGTEKGQSIAVWHALSHTSGYQGLALGEPKVAYAYSFRDFVAHLTACPQLFQPGTVFSYVHSEYVLLGEICERITGRQIRDLYREMIFEPLKLTVGSIRADLAAPAVCVVDHTPLPDPGQFKPLRPIPFGGFWRASLSDLTLSLPDLLTLTEALAGVGDRRYSPPNPEALAFVRKQVIKMPRTYGGSRPEQVPGAFGLGCAAYRGWLLGHNGSARGQTCGLRFDPKNGMALVVGMNSWQPFLRDSMIDHVFGALRGAPITQPAAEPLDVPLGALEGEYLGPVGSRMTVSVEGRRVICTMATSGAAPPPFVMEQNEAGELVMCSDPGHHSLCFFSEPATGARSLMLGLTAFRRREP